MVHNQFNSETHYQSLLLEITKYIQENLWLGWVGGKKNSMHKNANKIMKISTNTSKRCRGNINDVSQIL